MQDTIIRMRCKIQTKDERIWRTVKYLNLGKLHINYRCLSRSSRWTRNGDWWAPGKALDKKCFSLEHRWPTPNSRRQVSRFKWNQLHLWTPKFTYKMMQIADFYSFLSDSMRVERKIWIQSLKCKVLAEIHFHHIARFLLWKEKMRKTFKLYVPGGMLLMLK